MQQVVNSLLHLCTLLDVCIIMWCERVLLGADKSFTAVAIGSHGNCWIIVVFPFLQTLTLGLSTFW